MRPIRITSFGYLHLPTGPDGSPVPPAADRIEDVRDRLRDPAAARDILDLDGLNPRVQDVVLATPGARELLANLADYADLPAGPSHIAIGCAGGRHRASSLTEILGRELRARGREVVIQHLHVHLPRVLKTPATQAGQETVR
ncbi:RapZ C-terminal domain-containing protein [Streptomyces vinaceus]|uniref:RapZ C-terminal domain-containing protein n=1 Tax=Streptomyces vinaceus TaxID=1960 RepID=UPI0036B967E4